MKGMLTLTLALSLRERGQIERGLPFSLSGEGDRSSVGCLSPSPLGRGQG